MLTKEAVEHIAKLARLNLEESEKSAFATQLSAILDSFNEISKVDTNNVEPLITPTDIELHLRADNAEKHGSTEELMQNAPARSGNLFKVPPVV